VPVAGKEEARRVSLAALGERRPDVDTVLVRINAVGTPWFDADLAAAAEAVAGGALDGVVLPKYEHPEQLASVRAALPSGAVVVVGIESVLGVADARPLLAEAPEAAYFGAEDFIADIGGRRTSGGSEVLYARSQVCLAACLAGVSTLDQVTAAVRDTEAFRADAEMGRSLGYNRKDLPAPRPGRHRARGVHAVGLGGGARPGGAARGRGRGGRGRRPDGGRGARGRWPATCSQGLGRNFLPLSVALAGEHAARPRARGLDAGRRHLF